MSQSQGTPVFCTLPVIPPQGVSTVSFSGADHTVRESTGYVTIEIQASQSFPEASTVTVQTQDGTAVGECGYTNINVKVSASDKRTLQ